MKDIVTGVLLLGFFALLGYGTATLFSLEAVICVLVLVEFMTSVVKQRKLNKLEAFPPSETRLAEIQALRYGVMKAQIGTVLMLLVLLIERVVTS